MANIKNFFTNHKNECIIAGVIIIVAIIALVCVLTFSGNGKTEVVKGDDSVKKVTAEGVVKDETYKGLKFTNVQLAEDGENYTLTMEVTNTNSETSKITRVFIPLKDKDGKTIISLLGYIGDDLKPNETRTITASTGLDLSKATDKSITEEQE